MNVEHLWFGTQLSHRGKDGSVQRICRNSKPNLTGTLNPLEESPMEQRLLGAGSREELESIGEQQYHRLFTQLNQVV